MRQLPEISRLHALKRSFTMVHDPISVLTEDIAQKGDTYFTYIGGIKRALVTVNPQVMRHVLQKNHRNYIKSEIQTDMLAQYIGKGLLTSEGDYWRRQRRLIQPGFHKSRIKNLVSLIQEVVDQQLDKLESKRGKVIDFYPEMIEVAFKIIGNAMFSESATQDELSVIKNAILKLQQFIIKRIRQPYKDPLFWLNGERRKHDRIAKEVDKVVLDIIGNRKQQENQPDDLLGMLIDTCYEDTGASMSEEQLLWETKILFVAGHETTANVLTWMLYLLAKHPKVVAALNTEINQNISNEDLQFESLMNMPLLNAVIMETMRLYPPAWVMDRVAKEEDAFGDIIIPKGTLVIPLVYHAHRLSSEWESPEQFNPQRFINTKNHSAYFPFGAGPRMCIGNNFAMLEMQIFLVKFLRKFKVELSTETNSDAKALITLKPAFGMKLKLV